MSDGLVTIAIDSNDTVTATPDDVTPDDNNTVVFTLNDQSGHGWVFDEDRPIIIVNPQDFNPTRNSDTQLTVTDSEADRARNPTHKYTLRFTRPGRPNPLLFDPIIRDRSPD